MTDKSKTNGQLIDELNDLRKKLDNYEKADAGRVSAEEELKESESRYRSLFQQSPESIVILDRDGTILDLNREIGLIGLRREEIIGKKFFELGLVSESEMNALFARVVAGHVEPFELSIQTPAHERIWMEIHPALIGENLRFMVKDITERKLAEEELREIVDISKIRAAEDQLKVSEQKYRTPLWRKRQGDSAS